MSGYDSLEDVWRWVCPECTHRLYKSWSPETLEACVELHEAVVHGIPRVITNSALFLLL